MSINLSTEIIPLQLRPGDNPFRPIQDYIQHLSERQIHTLRWGAVGRDQEIILFEIATITDGAPAVRTCPEAESSEAPFGTSAVLAIPTGVGAQIGGFIGDAGPVAKALEGAVDHLILHPNVANAADFYGAGSRSLYVDGLTLDRFLIGEVNLAFRAPPKIGIVIDALRSEEIAQIVNAANAIRATAGIQIVGYTVCKAKVDVRVSRSIYGHFVGAVSNADVLFTAADKLIEQGADALAVVTGVDGISAEDWQAHYAGQGPNPIGSVEALMSRAVTWKFGLPCAHAPAFIGTLGRSSLVVDPRAAAEVASGTGLPSVLLGLTHAPRITFGQGLSARNLNAIVVPFDCAGGSPALAAHRFGIPLLTVRENRCTLGLSADHLPIETIVPIENYAEAIAFLICQKAGIDWSTIRRPLAPVTRI